MDPERLIGELVGGFLGGKKKRRRGGFDLSSLAGGVLGGGRRSSGGLVNAGTLLTVGGLIWGAIETMQQGSGTPTTPGGQPGGGHVPPVPPSTPGAPPRGVMGTVGDVPLPPPLPPIPGATPPMPVSAEPVPAALVPLVQLAVSAAHADGDLADEEVATIRARAAALGAAGLVDAEIAARRPLEAITPAFTTDEQKLAAYALAWAVVHGEGEVSPGERMYLTQLQRLLRLEHADVDRIEHETLAGGAQ